MKTLKSTLGALAAGLVLTSGCDLSNDSHKESTQDIAKSYTTYVGEYIGYSGNAQLGVLYGGMPNKDTLSIIKQRSTRPGGPIMAWNEFHPKGITELRLSNKKTIHLLEVKPDQITWRTAE